jgi:hypothetical protein
MGKFRFLGLFLLSILFVGLMYGMSNAPRILYYSKLSSVDPSNAYLQRNDQEIYVTDFENNKILIIDASNPKTLKLLWEVTIAGDVDATYIKNSIGYFSVHESGIEIWDLTEPQNPERIDIQTFPNDVTPALACNMGYAYCLSKNNLYCYNISGFQSFDLVYQKDIGAQQSNPVLSVNEEYLYLMNSSGFYIFNITNPSTITLLSKSVFIDAVDFYVSDNRGYILTNDSTFHIYDLTDPTNPEQIIAYQGPWIHFLKWFRENNWTFRSIIVNDDFAYIGFTGNVGIYRIDISNPKEPICDGFFQCCPESNIIVFENILFVLDSEIGLITFDITDPNNGIYNLALFLGIFYICLLIITPSVAHFYKNIKRKRLEMADKDFIQKMERAAAAGKKPTFALDDKELLEKFQKLMKISQKVSQRQVASYLGISEENLFPKLVDWGSQLPIKVDGEWISIDNVQSFMDTLDTQFMEWDEKETTKVGKIE